MNEIRREVENGLKEMQDLEQTLQERTNLLMLTNESHREFANSSQLIVKLDKETANRLSELSRQGTLPSNVALS